KIFFLVEWASCPFQNLIKRIFARGLIQLVRLVWALLYCLCQLGQYHKGTLKLNEHFLNKEFLPKFLTLLHAQMLANSVACFSTSFAKIQGVWESETQTVFTTPKIECEKK
ncbi:hypothetical protein QUB70_11610, partial [Microcoleus sp. A003_D6]|uniref:hypothetical protein n=1 Tax=Microcoleus sp. A003_D6 TaxID=3055266 RepID=UPI002FD5B715